MQILNNDSEEDIEIIGDCYSVHHMNYFEVVKKSLLILNVLCGSTKYKCALPFEQLKCKTIFLLNKRMILKGTIQLKSNAIFLQNIIFLGETPDKTIRLSSE